MVTVLMEETMAVVVAEEWLQEVVAEEWWLEVVVEVEIKWQLIGEDEVLWCLNYFALLI